MDLKFGISVIDRNVGNFPAIPVINLFAETVPIEDHTVLQSRPGLTTAGITMGTGPITGLYEIDGVVNSGLYGVSGGSLYNSGVLVGAINGTGPTSMAGFESILFVCAGQDVFGYNGTTLTAVTEPGGFAVADICVGTSRLIVVDSGTGKFYWSDVLSSTINALSFATAENSPDKLKACLFLGDTLMLFGTETIEFWPASTVDPTLPFTPLIGRTIQLGVRDTDAACLYSGSFAWITNRNDIRVGNANTIVSTPSIEEKIAKSSVARLWSFMLESTEFLALTLDTRTFVFSSKSSQWSEFESYGQVNFIPRCFAKGYFGSSLDGTLSKWNTTYDDFGSILERRFRAGSLVNSSSVPLNNVILRNNPGETTYTTGNYADPTIELRTSRDGGFEWGPWKARSLGVLGKYRKSVSWNSLGFFGHPSLLVEFRVTDPVPFRVSNVTANEFPVV